MNEKSRPLGVLQVIKTGLLVYRRHFLRFFALSITVGLPIYLLFLLFAVPVDVSNPIVRIYAGLNTLVFALVGSTMIRIPLLYEMIQEKEGNHPSFTESLGALFRYGWPVFFTAVLTCLFIVFGLILLIVPGLVMLVWFAFYPQVLIKEKTGIVESLVRSKELVTGSAIKVFFFLIFCFVLEYATSLLLVDIALASFSTNILIALGVQCLLYVLLLPVEAAILTIAYYDCRLRKEAYQPAAFSKMGRTTAKST
ncbi:hypothetical protein [Aneurinibacillus sp. REN35]|uniref:hypothetical protein n=1 Tax=Aneurinibacillus sp. REN35 TaxID=3237286 RepID=UPI003528721C